MKYTNRKNLPQIICDAVANDPYHAGDTDFSATTLIKPSYQVFLQAQHKDEITEDVADRLWAMYGNATHTIIERGASDNDMIEKRFYATIMDKKISAQIDHYRNHNITDWKLTAAYKVKKAMWGDHQDWSEQLNIQAYLMEQNGHPVEKLFIGAMCRDWSKQKWMTEEGYPDQIEYIEIPIWSERQQLAFIEQRIQAMLNPEPCTRQERWQDPDTFAVMKHGVTRALKVEKSKDAAFQYCCDKRWIVIDLDDDSRESISLDDDHYIDTREAPNKRCEFYCNVAEFCDYYKAKYMVAEDLPFKQAGE